MKISNNSVSFNINIDFEGCDVDMVYKEIRSKGYSGAVPSLLVGEDTHKFNGNKTPIGDSVNFCLLWLAGYVDREQMCTQTSRYFDLKTGKDHITELEKLGIEVTEWSEFMQGCCSLECKVSPDLYSKELVSLANKVVFDVFNKYVKYYKVGKKAA